MVSDYNLFRICISIRTELVFAAERVCMYVCINESYDCCIQILWLMSRIGVECEGNSGHIVMRLSNCDTEFFVCEINL
jgi:hypothetical protein